MTAARPRAIAFDLDGTLVDSRHDLAEAVNRARADLGMEPLAVDAVLGMVGEGARNLVRRALGGAPEPELLERAFARFLAHYGEVCLDATRPYAGIDELLAGLAAAADRPYLAVLTNKPESFSRRIVAHFGWSPLFDELVGGDTLPSRKPEPAGLLRIAAHAGAAASDTLLVGDSAIDAATAAAARARFLFVPWGFARPDERVPLAAGPAVRDAGELARRLLGG
jgi:phosphoglycolate phosphatase